VALYEAVLSLATTVNGLSIIRFPGRLQQAEIGGELNRLYYFFSKRERLESH
jgi:hypothetical protein